MELSMEMSTVRARGRTRTLKLRDLHGKASANAKASKINRLEDQKPGTVVHIKKTVAVKKARPRCCAAHRCGPTTTKWQGTMRRTFLDVAGAQFAIKPPLRRTLTSSQASIMRRMVFLWSSWTTKSGQRVKTCT